MSGDPSNDPDGPGEVRRDAHLRAALRHAADAGALPPNAVAEAIRHAARLAVSAPPATVAAAGVAARVRSERTLGDALRGLWQSLAAPRPVWAGGAAALVVTLLTVNTWVGEPLPPAVQADGPADSAPTAPVITAPAPAPAPAPSPATLSSPAPAPAPAPEPSRLHADRPGATPAISEARSRRKEAPPTAADESRVRTTQPAQTAVAPAATAPTTPLPEQAAAPMPSAAAVGAVTAPTATETPAPTGLAKSRSLADAGTGPSRMAPTPSRELSLAAKAVAPPTPQSLASWLRAARQNTDDPAWPMTPSQRRVLQQLELAARGRWQAVVPTTQPALPVQPTQSEVSDARAMSWRSDTGQIASLRVDHQGAHWTEPGGRSWFAPLDNAARSALLREF